MRKAHFELKKEEENKRREQDSPGEAGSLQDAWELAILELKGTASLVSSAGSPYAGTQRNYENQKGLCAGF